MRIRRQEWGWGWLSFLVSQGILEEGVIMKLGIGLTSWSPHNGSGASYSSFHLIISTSPLLVLQMKKLRVREEPLVREKRAETGTQVSLDPLALLHNTRLGHDGN